MENKLGKSSRQIFRECGFDEKIVTVRRILECGKRWRRLQKVNITTVLSDTRGGRLNRDLSEEEQIERLKTKITYF